jgi:hypothetical protein
MKTVLRNTKFAFGGLLMAVITLAISCSKSNSSKSNTHSGPPPADATHVYLQDTAFRNYLQAKICPDAIGSDGRLDITNAEVVGFSGTMTIDSSTYKIHSLNGINYFTKMSKLIIQNSLVDSLNLPTTMALDTIRLLSDADMQFVNVSGCSNMRYIRFSYIPATSIDLSNLPMLNTISGIASGRLATMKVDNDANLQHILCYGLNALTGVNTSTCPNLQRLFLEVCYSIASLDVSQNPKLSWLMATYAGGLKSVDLSKNPALYMVSFEQSGIDSIDFSHNPALFCVSMVYAPALKGINVSANPNLHMLSLDGCGYLKKIDLRAQSNFNFYQMDFTKVNPGNAISQADLYELYPGGFYSSTPGGLFTLADSAARKSEGATMNLYGGLRLPTYLDGNGLSLTNVWVNDAVKNNYSLCMTKNTGGFVAPAVVTAYAADQTTITCADYNPVLETCN